MPPSAMISGLVSTHPDQTTCSAAATGAVLNGRGRQSWQTHPVFKRKREPGSQDSWTLSEGTYDGKRLIVRRRVDLGSLPESANHAIKVGMAVPFRNPQPDGMPSTQELAELEAIEDRLIAEMADRAVLVLVLTTNNMREFVAYTAEGDWLPAFDRTLQTVITSHDVQIDARTDPRWDAWRAFGS